MGFAAAVAVSAMLGALKAARLRPGSGVDFGAALVRTLSPAAASDWVRLAGLGVVGLVAGVGAAAFLAARFGVRGTRKA